MRKASRSGPRETPKRAASAASVSLAPGASSPERIMRSSSPCTTLASELVCSRTMVGCALVERAMVVTAAGGAATETVADWRAAEPATDGRRDTLAFMDDE